MTQSIRAEEYDDVAPDASSMIEAMRAYGYNLATAVSDLIDNSITSGCRNVWLRFVWDEADGSNSWISVTDDGNGMTEKVLVDSMRLGSTSPLMERRENDLGRFGLGLKTASFSQARRLTVVTRSEPDSTALRRWDLDHLARPEVQGWQLLRSPHPDTGDRAKALDGRELQSGTQILLEILDRVPGCSDDDQDPAGQNFAAEVERVEKHLAMVFHRFLADPYNKRIRIWINERPNPIEPWDPFVPHRATQAIPPEVKNELGADVKFQGFVLPHRDKFDESDRVNSQKLHRQAGGPAGWNAQQGFYLYRNRRLIIAGDWLGLGPGTSGWKKEEHYKLARIRIDIPNSADKAWQIDVKKSTASVPPVLRRWLEGYAKTVRERAKAVYSHRGAYGQRPRDREETHEQPWKTKLHTGGRYSYRIDRTHTLFAAIIDQVPPQTKRTQETFLRLIEETVPVRKIYIDTAENQEAVADPFEGEKPSKLQYYIRNCHLMLRDRGMNDETAWMVIGEFPAFSTREAQTAIGLEREAALSS